ncbi:hypothetical protein N431DRAFT_547718 [Stipitochalara longipes BDJ]|nr:hypothetical protein N431DRAFT_547718 [Stipitochalara longipes BDJ]
MDLDTDDDVLRILAEGKPMDYEQWPGLLARLIPRLEKIVQNDFTFPIPPILASQPISSSPPTQETTSSQDSTNKENAAPPLLTRYPPQIQTLMTSITSTLTTLFTKYPPHTVQRLAELLLAPKQHYKTLPSYLHALDRVVHVTSGAHTFPLPPAIPDPSSLTVLSNGTSLTASGKDPLSISWGNPASNPTASSLGSDESLGGALLTPITWLQKNGGSVSPLEGEVRTESTETIDGPNGPGGVETVSVSVNGVSSTTSPTATTASEPGDLAAALRAEGGITQGELLRQEQRAGVVPAAQLVGKGDESGMGEEDELPHARGPEEIGMEDVGMQGATGSERMVGTTTMGMQGIDVEAAVGRRIAPKPDPSAASADTVEKEGEGKVEGSAEAPTTPKRDADEELSGEGKKLKVDSTTSGPEAAAESVEVDADGRTAEEPKVGEQGENKGGDAVDMSSV